MDLSQKKYYFETGITGKIKLHSHLLNNSTFT